VFAGRDAGGTGVLVYYFDTERTIYCTEVGPEEE
jgi:hypothetical protein